VVPFTEVTVELEELPERTSMVQCILHVHKEEDHWLERFSSLSLLQRVIGYCLRFINRAQKRPASSGPISLAEQHQALHRAIKYIQKTYYSDLQNKSPHIVTLHQQL